MKDTFGIDILPFQEAFVSPAFRRVPASPPPYAIILVAFGDKNLY